MHISENGLNLIKSYETLRLKAYKATPNEQYYTIGYGHYGKDVKADAELHTEQQALNLLRQDLNWVEERVNKFELTQNQYDALCSFVFNVGATNFLNSSLYKYLKLGEYSLAAKEFTVWNKQTNKKTGKKEEVAGLTKRRIEEKALFLKD